MTDPRAPKIIIPEDANFLIAKQYKKQLEERHEELLQQILKTSEQKGDQDGGTDK